MQIRGIDGMTVQDIHDEIERGARFVHFEWCVSVLVVTVRRPSDVVFLRSGDSGFLHSLPYNLTSVLFGWWGIPLGILYTPLTLWNNLCGGRDVTAHVLPLLATLVPEPTNVPTGD